MQSARGTLLIYANPRKAGTRMRNLTLQEAQVKVAEHKARIAETEWMQRYTWKYVWKPHPIAPITL